MRLATFNVENLFDRAAVMNLPTWKEGRPALEDFSRLMALIGKETYSKADKDRMLEIMGRNTGLLTAGKSDYILLREVRGKLTRKKRGGPREIAVGGRGEWVGWFELVEKPVEEAAVENTARVILELKADILCVVEAEHRVALKEFNGIVIPRVGGKAFHHVMLIDGNDGRGIDVGIMTREGYPIRGIASHVDDRDGVGEIFSRDCAEYFVGTPAGNTLLVLVNHFKSKGYGGGVSSDAKRRRQAARVREIYEERLGQGHEYIAIAGDLNDTPESDALSPLLKDGSNLVDVMAHPKFQGDGRPGTHGNGTKGSKLDYVLMSPGLAGKVQGAGIERRGVWGGKHGTLFPHFEQMEKPEDAASDHAALWVEADI